MNLTLSKRVDNLEATRRPTTKPARLAKGTIDACLAKLQAIVYGSKREDARRAKLPIDEQIALLDKDRAAEIAKREEPRTSDAILTNLDAVLERLYTLRRAELVARRGTVGRAG